jgi:hypothetical protein
MDFNDFIKKCQEKYSKHGVTMVSLSVWGDICSIYLTRPEGGEHSEDEIYVGLDEDIEVIKSLPLCYAHYKSKMPLDEEQIFEWLDKWFEEKEIEGYSAPLLN